MQAILQIEIPIYNTSMRFFVALGVLIVASVAAFFVWPTVKSLLSQPVQQVACTEEAKICPDGSAVGREGPNCEFAACPTPQPIAQVSYQCSGGKTIQATLYEGTTTPAATPDQPPTPGGSAKVVLSDGRTLTLKQTISADGVRYSDGDPMVKGAETFVFWSKGDGALVLENNVEKSYIGCKETVAQ